MKYSILPGIFFLMMIGAACKEKSQSEKTDGSSEMSKDDKAMSGQATYQIDPQNSNLKWKGSGPGGSENGFVPFSGGSVKVKDGAVTEGTIEIDMKNITVESQSGDMKGKLESHLKGTAPGKEEDFFNVDKYPKAYFKITSSSRLENDPNATHKINGDLTIKNITKPISFNARIDIKDNVLTAVASPFKVDRTEFDIKYKSKKFFDNLKDDFINDEFEVEFNVVARK